MSDQTNSLPFDPDFDSDPTRPESNASAEEKSVVVKINLNRETVFDILTLVVLGSTIYFGWSIYNLSKLVS